MPTQTHVPSYTKHLPLYRHLHTHTPFNTYTHLHTHLATCILHANSIRRLSGRAAGINFTSTVTLNPFQKTYNRPSKIIFRETRKNYYGTWPLKGGPALPSVLDAHFFVCKAQHFRHIDFTFHRIYTRNPVHLNIWCGAEGLCNLQSWFCWESTP